VADASTERNPEFINNISEFLTRPATTKFINAYIGQLKEYYAQLQLKQAAIRDKVAQDIDLNKQDIELITNKIKSQQAISDEERTLLEKLEKPAEKENGQNGDAESEEQEEDVNYGTGTGDGSFLTQSEKGVLIKILEVDDASDEDQMSQRLEKLYGLKHYPFNALEVVPNLSEEQVAEIFTRINSKGTVLRQADFILTLLSVFWEKGREQIDEFCRLAKKVPEKDSAWFLG
jgi:hypothetical protein